MVASNETWPRQRLRGIREEIDMYDIPVRYKDVTYYARVSPEDYANLSKHSWHRNSHGYPATKIKGKTYPMHVLVLGKWSDHKNRNKMDNRRENLRPTDNQRNQINRVQPKRVRGGHYRGVNKHNKGGWQASIRIPKLSVYIGYFGQDEVAAALAYDAVAAQWHGHLAILNFPGDIDNLLIPR